MARIVRYTFAGMLGAVVAWAIMEWTPLMPDVEGDIPYAYKFVIGMVSGLLIGLALGIAEGVSGLSPRDAVRSVLFGAGVGAVGGILGITFGGAVYGAFFKIAGGATQGPSLPSDIPAEARPPGITGPLAFILLLIGRGFGWAIIGAFIGVAQGIPMASTKRMVNGAVGGFIGGGLGGGVFEILAWMNRGGVSNFPPQMIRFISFAITGAAIGLFVGFVEELAKQAWLIRLIGRNEGKEFTIYKTVTVIGRSEFADIPVFEDPDVAPEHARITANARRHTIQDMGSTFGTSLNGQKISQPEVLRDGDEIVVGKTRFQFRDKATSRGYVPTPSYAPVQLPTSGSVCPFCGQTKDASGKCGCSVGGGAQQTMQQTVQQTMQPTMQPTMQQPVGQSPDVTSPFGGPTIQPQAAPVGARLVAIGGPLQGQMFTLGSVETKIGRDAACDIPLSSDNTVSRAHSRIAQESGGYVVYDLGSTNGTFVNGQRITQHYLTNGDLVQIGSNKFRFEG